ncbi:universal stress protein [Nocardia shimofusensis]|uniref:universal stress protein n=1 Tax=Nocardia shimofusensis TaxID=228596 RepID=UPI000A05C843|nr:universal stress protein [Nocardia shimofusensis]
MNWTVLTVFVVVWVLIGLATGLWMARRGHDVRWTLIAVILGPLFVPIAYERAERGPRSVEAKPVGRWEAATSDAGELRVMVGYDGSAQAQHALQAALSLFGSGKGVLELVAVVSYDDETDPDSAVLHTAKQKLAEVAAAVQEAPVGYAILAGPPGQCLRWFAEDQRADVVVVGKRGRGMSTRMLGSVTEYLTAHCDVPVLVVGSSDSASGPLDVAASSVRFEYLPTGSARTEEEP